MRMSMIAITYIGHATTLIESNAGVVLTDPNFSDRVLFSKRAEQLTFDPGSLPELTAVVISHAHLDHLNIDSFKYIKGSVPVFVPQGIGNLLGKFIRNPVIELKEWSTHKLPNGTEITATHAEHTGFRWVGLRYKKCSGYIISSPNNGGRIFFAGDTAYGPHFKDISLMNASPIDVALLPIGGYEPKWLMQKRHLNPVDALQAFLDTGAKHMIPIHYGTFRLSLEKLNEPAEWLARLSIERNLSAQVHILKLKSGEQIKFD